jgi:FixJ family two-component response regulator
MAATSLVCIVDDDESVRESVAGLLRSVGLKTRAFTSADEFLAVYEGSLIGCVILDVTMPGMSGADLQEHLRAKGNSPPIVFITARTEPALHARLLERGAIACLVKPFQEEELFAAVHTATGMVEARGW